MKKICRKLHLWLSIPFGVIIAVVCLSGAALVFEDEVMELCNHNLYYVKTVEADPLPMNQLLAKVAATLPDSVAVTGVTLSSDPERTYKMSLSKPRRASIYVNPYTGEVMGKSGRTPFFLAMFKTHRWLTDSMKPDGGIFWGKMIVGVSTLMMVFVLISGIVIWWPRTKKALKNGFKIVTAKGTFRLWYSVHVAGGVYTLFFLLVMALTGLTWSFSWYRTGFYKVFGVETKHGGGGGGHGASSLSASTSVPYLHWQHICDTLKTMNPDFSEINLSKEAATVSFDGWGNQRAADRYAFDPVSGVLTDVTFYKDADRSSKIRGWIYSVHVGDWGGITTRILTFIAALLGGTLPLTGYYLWWRKRWGHGKRTLLEQRK